MSSGGGSRLERIDHVQLAIPQGGEDLARAFWVTLMGLVEVEKPAALARRGGAWFESPGIVGTAGMAGITGIAVHVGVEAEFRPNQKAHPAFVVADLDALATACAAAGLPVRWDSEIPGVRRFHTDDPFGNRIELISSSGALPLEPLP